MNALTDRIIQSKRNSFMVAIQESVLELGFSIDCGTDDDSVALRNELKSDSAKFSTIKSLAQLESLMDALKEKWINILKEYS